MGSVDLVLVAAYLVAVVVAGAWFSRRQRTTRHYFTGSGRVPWWAVSASIVATETSTITFVSVPGIAYAWGGDLRFLQLALGYVVGRVAIALFLVPKYFQGELLTVYQLLATRFGNGVKGMLAALFVVMRTLADGVRLLLTATVLVAVGKVFAPEAETETLVVGGIVVMGLVMLLFTLWGGMEAVIWIEVVQLGIYLAGALAAAAVLLGKIPGGLDAVLDDAVREGKLRWLSFDLTVSKEAGFTFWAGVIGGAFLNVSTHGTDQYMVQRYLCVERPRDAAKALLLSGVAVFAQFALFLGIGLLLLAFNDPRRGPSLDGPGYGSESRFFPFSKGDEVFPHFIANELPPGLGGLVIAAILAAALSSSLNSIAATTLADLWRPLFGRADDARELRLSRIFTVVAGAAQIAVALALLRTQESALTMALTIASLFNGPVLGIFLLGTLTRGPRTRAALAGIAAGTVVVLGIWWNDVDLFWPWYTAIGSLTTLLAGILAHGFETRRS